MNNIELEEKLEREYVTIDVKKLAKSKIKQIVLPLHRFIEWQTLDLDGKALRKGEMFDNCLDVISAEKAKTLNRLYSIHVWNLLDDDVKNGLDFEDFIS